MATPEAIGNYLVQRLLGSGGFATVWLATDPLLDAPVAIKVLADNWSRHREVRERFIDEARMMRRIDDDRIVRIHHVGELSDGRAYAVMSWADRGSLSDRIAERRRAGRTFSLAEILALGDELAACLGVIHRQGIVHRDVKPSNILFRSVQGERGGEVGERMVLADFGLAKDVLRSSGLTQAAGTPAYMAPEQSRPGGRIDQRADVFAAAAVLYELATGEAAFPSTGLSTVARDRPGYRPPPVRERRPDLPEGVQAVLERGMASDADRRYGSAQELVDALAAASGVRALVVPDHRPLSEVVAALLDEIEGGTFGELDGTSGARARLVAPVTMAAMPGEAREMAADLAAEVDRVTGHRLRVSAVDAFAPAAQDLAAADMLVLSLPASEWLGSTFVDIRPGPLIVATIDDIESLLQPATYLAQAVDAVVASGALALLEGLVEQRWASAPVAGRIADLRFEHPELDQLMLLRDLVTGRQPLPPPLATEGARLLLPAPPAARLGLHEGVPVGDWQEEAAVAARRWRSWRATGRIPGRSLRLGDTVGDLCGRLSVSDRP